MATKKTPAATSAASGGRSTAPLVIGIVAAVVVVFAIIAVVLSGGGDDDASGSGLTFAPGATIREFQGVTVTGDSLPPSTDTGGDTAIGMTAPGLTGAGFDGTPVTVTPGDGSPYMLVFLAHWCPHCQAEVPRIVQWHEEGRVPEGLKVVAIATSTDQTRPNYPPSDWLVDEDWPFQAMADSPQFVARDAYGLDGFPYIVVIDAEGKVQRRTSGEKTIDELDQLVDDALGVTASADTTAATETSAP